ncbi:MAG TPA: peptidoglycan-binding protein, partial [Vineibacter sp.]|nr:peptidoglycan-binding protein [Vineibacter sp.]
MTLTAPKWSPNRRLQAASENRPSMKPGEPDRAAVKLLQEVLIASGFAIPSGPTGNYLAETASAVRAVQVRFKLTLDNGIAGREVLGALDALLKGQQPPITPKGAADDAKPLALKWVTSALFAIQSRIIELQVQGLQINPFVRQLNVHFHLDRSAAGRELANLQALAANYTRIHANLLTSDRIFRSVDDATATRDTLGLFGPGVLMGAYTFTGVSVNFTSQYPGLGRNAQAAVMVHEMGHFISPSIGHVGGESGPAYDNSNFTTAIHNAHCYS